MHVHDDRDVATIHVNKVSVRRGACIIPTKTTSTCEHALGIFHLVAKNHIAKIVNDVRAPVTELTIAEIPIPVPIVMKLVAIK